MAIINGNHILAIVQGNGDTLSQKFTNTLTSYHIPSGVTYIPIEEFKGRTNLTSITIPDSVTQIGKEAFRGCTGLTNVSLPNVQFLNENAFHGCTGLTSVTLSNLLVQISGYVFRGCNNLKRINSDVDGEVNIPSSVTGILGGAFWDCTKITKITFPSNITAGGFGNNMCNNCTSLKNVTLPTGLSTLPEGTFTNCTSLQSVTLTSNFTTINKLAFAGCSSLVFLTLKYNGVVTLQNTNAIPASSTQHVNIMVPSAQIASYQTATNWKTLYDNGYISFLADPS